MFPRDHVFDVIPRAVVRLGDVTILAPVAGAIAHDLWRNVLGRHVLRNGLLPTIAVISTQVGYLFGGIVAIEKLFGYPGIGFLTLTSAQIKNVPMLLACVLILGIVYFVATLSGDLLIAALNPRVRLQGRD